MQSQQHRKSYRGPMPTWALALVVAGVPLVTERARAQDGVATPPPAAASAEPAASPASQPAAAEPAPSAAQEAVAKPAPHAGAARPKGDGGRLVRAATEAIRADASMVAPDALKLNITAKGGIVALSGTAGTIYDREQATRDAEGVQGVTGVRPSISIKSPVTIEVGALQDAVVQAVKDANVAGPSFAASASADGTVQLAGEVSHEWLAINAVKRVLGVTAIAGYAAQRAGKIPPAANAELTIVPPSPEQDAVLLKAVEAALASAGLDKLQASVVRGVAGLKGQPSGIREWYAATRAISGVEGILGVDQNVKIPSRAWRVGDERSEADITADARRRLRPLGLAGISVRVNGGSVLLSGRVGSENAAYAAVEAVAAVAGVQEIVNAMSYPTQVTRS